METTLNNKWILNEIPWRHVGDHYSIKIDMFMVDGVVSAAIVGSDDFYGNDELIGMQERHQCGCQTCEDCLLMKAIDLFYRTTSVFRRYEFFIPVTKAPGLQHHHECGG